jgi:hypothetical protein
MLFGEMVDKVVTRTKRPDKLDQVQDAVNNAISFFSLGASFSQDLIEGTVVIDGTLYAQSLIISANLARFRRIKYLKRTGARGYLKKADPLKVFDAAGCEQLDRWYRSGDNLVFKLAVLSPTLEYGYFAYPALLEDTDDAHWMMDVVPLMVFNKAASEIFSSINEDGDARTHEARAMQMFEIAKNDFEDGATATSE